MARSERLVWLLVQVSQRNIDFYALRRLNLTLKMMINCLKIRKKYSNWIKSKRKWKRIAHCLLLLMFLKVLEIMRLLFRVYQHRVFNIFFQHRVNINDVVTCWLLKELNTKFCICCKMRNALRINLFLLFQIYTHSWISIRFHIMATKDEI